MILTASKLRENVYRVLDRILETGEPVEIERNGRRLRIIADQPTSKLDRLLTRPDVVVGDSDDLVEVDWSSEWSPTVLETDSPGVTSARSPKRK